MRGYFIGSFKLCLLSSLLGAVFGAILAYAVASGNPDGTVRRLYLAVSGVLAQFGGVTLAFAFLALIGPVGLLFHASWFYYVPVGHHGDLRVLPDPADGAGLPARDRRAEGPVAGGVGEPRRVRVAVLAACRRPAAGAGLPRRPLLLFANALSAFATIWAWENQIAYIVPQQISIALSSEVGLSNVNVADLLALGMVIMVAIVMTGYALLQRRAARWLR